MDKSISYEFVVIMNKLRKLTHKYHPKGMVHPGEFMMLGAIHGYMKEKHAGCGKESIKKEDDRKENEYNEPGVKISDLSEMIHSTKPATSKMLNILEEKGYIERIADKKDRRVVYVRLSNEGEKIITDAFKQMYEFADNTISRMGESDAKELIRLMNVFLKSLEDVVHEKSNGDANKEKESE